MSAAKARASFDRVTRQVLKTRKPVLVETRDGIVQITPHDSREYVPPAPRGGLKHTDREIELSNRFGGSL